MDLSSHKHGAMPSGAAESLCRSLSALRNNPSSEGSRLSPAAYQKILHYCGVRPDLAGWRRFLLLCLSLLGFLALACGVVFFIAWNWALMPKMAKFAVVELWIVALAVVVWWRWYDSVAQSALLALGLSFGGLFALYGQVYQTGADSWELFRAWAIVLLPLALIARRNGLWFCFWVVANLAFQLYYVGRSSAFFSDIPFANLDWFSDSTLYIYIAIQACCLILREALAEYAQKRRPDSWLTSRWLPRLMAAYLLLTLTPLAAEAIVAADYSTKLGLLLWAMTILVGYFYYRHRRPDLCMLTLGVISVVFIGCILIMQLFDRLWDVGSLFFACCLMMLWLVAGGAVLLHWRRQLYQRQADDVKPDALIELLQELTERQLLSEEQSAELKNFDHASHLPWYLRAVLALGGWAAALIILALLALLLYATDLLDSMNGITLLVPSLIIAALAAGLLRAKGIGQQHIGLAWAIAATYGLCFSLYLFIDPDWNSNFIIDSLWFLPVLAVMAIFMPNRAYRFMAVTAFLFILVFSLGYLMSLQVHPAVATAATSLVVAMIVAAWIGVIARQDQPQTKARSELTLSLLHGIPAALMLLCLAGVHSDLLDDFFWNSSAPIFLPMSLGAGIAAGLILAGVCQAVVFRSPITAVYLPAACVCAGVALFSPGMGFGLLLLLAARRQGSKEWLAMAGAFLLLYLTYWYYFLGISLLHKSLLLLMTGLVLLGLALAAKKLLPAKGEGAVYEN